MPLLNVFDEWIPCDICKTYCKVEESFDLEVESKTKKICYDCINKYPMEEIRERLSQ